MPSDAIQIRGLTKRFDDVVAVDNLNLEVAAGEIFGLVGPDGAGKTAVLRMMAGIMSADAGAITIAGCDVIQHPEAVKVQISYMPQRFGLYEDLTVDENIRFYADIFRINRVQREQRSVELLRSCEMEDFRKRLAGQLSGGMKQKLGLVCALIHTPKVLLLDEPTNGVDPISRREFWGMLYALAEQGVTILSSTAYLDEAERCNRVALMDRGRLLLCDTPTRLKALIPGAVVAITSSQAREIRDRLSGSEGVSGVVLVGDAVHLFVDDAPRRVAEFRSKLDERGFSYDEIHQVQPTMEDLFVRVVAGRETGAAQ
jgi:ABC-2 type transport system ATP-binding protein